LGQDISLESFRGAAATDWATNYSYHIGSRAAGMCPVKSPTRTTEMISPSHNNAAIEA